MCNIKQRRIFWWCIPAAILLLAGMVRGRILNRVEIMCVFTALMVTAGISTFGLADQLVK
jgi:hypothetical protein